MFAASNVTHGTVQTAVTILQERIAQSRAGGGESRSSKDEVGGEEKGMTAVVKGSHMSLVDASHTTCVTDLHWLPGMAFTRDGRPPTATRVGCSSPPSHFSAAAVSAPVGSACMFLQVCVAPHFWPMRFKCTDMI